MCAALSGANASAVTIFSAYRFTAQTRANETPVEPPVYSMTVPCALSAPAFSAPSTMASAMRSFMLPVGFAASILSEMRQLLGTAMRWSGMSGVWPMQSRMLGMGMLAFGFTV